MASSPDNDSDSDNDNDSTSTVDTDDSEFSEFISSKWKDSVEIGLEIRYPLPSTEYLEDLEDLQQQQQQQLETELDEKGNDETKNDNNDNTNNNNNNDTTQTQTTLPPLILSTVLPETSIAPLFDGTQWAGTRVWKAAVLGLEYLVKRRYTELRELELWRHRRQQQRNSNSGSGSDNDNTNTNSGSSGKEEEEEPPPPPRPITSLLELGCGLGVPGMVWKQLLDYQHETATKTATTETETTETETAATETAPPRGRVVLTDRESLVEQLSHNVRVNFGSGSSSSNSSSNNIDGNNNNNNNIDGSNCSDDNGGDGGGCSIAAAPLDWSRAGIAALLESERRRALQQPQQQQQQQQPQPQPVFDVCLNCDCVYEPLYGREAWESLADVLIEIAKSSPQTLLVTALERRNRDNAEGFFQKLEASGAVVTPAERVARNDDDPHHVVEIYVTRGVVGVGVGVGVGDGVGVDKSGIGK